MRKLIVRHFALSRLTVLFGKPFSYGTGSIPMLSSFFIMGLGEVFYQPLFYVGVSLFFVFGFIIFGYFKMKPLEKKDLKYLSLFQKYNYSQIPNSYPLKDYNDVRNKVESIYRKKFYNILDFALMCLFFFGTIILFIFFYE